MKSPNLNYLFQNASLSINPGYNAMGSLISEPLVDKCCKSALEVQRLKKMFQSRSSVNGQHGFYSHHNSGYRHSQNNMNHLSQPLHTNSCCMQDNHRFNVSPSLTNLTSSHFNLDNDLSCRIHQNVIEGKHLQSSKLFCYLKNQNSKLICSNLHLNSHFF